MTSKTITANATGRCEATPDLATVEAIAIGEGDSARCARVTAKDRASTIRESLTSVSADQISTTEIRIQETDEVIDPVTDAQYQATERLHVECVPETAESVVVEVTDAGGTVQSVQFEVHETVYRRLQDEALTAAMERAREKVERIATVEGLTVGKMRDATTREVSTGMERIVDEALASNPETDLHPAPITVSEGVEVVYELTEE